MATKFAEQLEAAQTDVSTAWVALRRGMQLLDDVAPKLCEDAIHALEVTEALRDRLRRTLAVLDEL